MVTIISDIAGQYKALTALVDKLPKGEMIISVGDLCDRGPDSRQVIEFFMDKTSKGEAKVILGNHEHMLLDHYKHTKYYERDCWGYNGGIATITSFECNVPDSVIDWISKLPLFIEIDRYFISHSFINHDISVGECLNINQNYNYRNFDKNIIWNRSEPERIGSITQIAGHNAQFGFKYFVDDLGLFGVGIDTSKQKVLTGLRIKDTKKPFTIDNFEIYQQEYV